MASRDMRQANQELLDAAALLVDEWEDVPTGSVLRCFSRAVWVVRGRGCPPERLAAEAMSLARALLALRGAMVAGETVAVRETITDVVPEPRRAARAPTVAGTDDPGRGAPTG